MRVYDHQDARRGSFVSNKTKAGHSWDPPPPLRPKKGFPSAPIPPPKSKINKDFLWGVVHGFLLAVVVDIILLCILARGV